MQKYKKIGSLGRIDFDKGVYAWFCTEQFRKGLKGIKQKRKQGGT